MRWREKLKGSGRREASTFDDLVLQIAADNSVGRFKPRPAGIPPPREVFLGTVDAVVSPLAESGWRYARSGPHLSRRIGDIAQRIVFGSSSLNVAGELVTLHVSLEAHDRVMAAWRKTVPQAHRNDGLVARAHLGHLRDPPVWLDWNLAASDPTEAVAEVNTAIVDLAIPFLDTIHRGLAHADFDPVGMAGVLDESAVVEYLVRVGRKEEAGRFIAASVDRFEHGRAAFDRAFRQMRDDGLPDTRFSFHALAYLALQFGLTVPR